MAEQEQYKRIASELARKSVDENREKIIELVEKRVGLNRTKIKYIEAFFKFSWPRHTTTIVETCNVSVYRNINYSVADDVADIFKKPAVGKLKHLVFQVDGKEITATVSLY
ncbi:MAG: hypothetical protein PHG23_00645 [Candidatus Pacebacteria bacterium]|nr:hypothetical protein [Candidatus Paceibacterota bacterium]